MAKKLYVGNLPFSFSPDQLRDLFAPFGRVLSARIISDKFTGQSKGFGFVEMENDEEALEARSKLNGSSAGSRRIVVDEARPSERRGPGGAAESA
jgi:RNA recognition motif-containing protein